MPPLSEATLSTPLGPLLLRADERGITAVQFVRSLSGKGGANVPMRRCILQMKEYFAGTRKAFHVGLHLQGTSFQQSVWKAVARVPYGSVVTYGELARRIGKPRAARAVGSALNKNPFVILIPCHRVVPASGKSGNYSGGGARKRRLLALERKHH